MGDQMRRENASEEYYDKIGLKKENATDRTK